MCIGWMRIQFAFKPNQVWKGLKCSTSILVWTDLSMCSCVWPNHTHKMSYSLVNQPLLPCNNCLQYLMAGRRVWALTQGFHVNTTRDLGSSNWPIIFENTLAISRDCNEAVWRLSRPEIVTVLEESTISWVYKLCPKQTEAVLAFVCRYDVSVSPPKGTHSAEDITCSCPPR